MSLVVPNSQPIMRGKFILGPFLYIHHMKKYILCLHEWMNTIILTTFLIIITTGLVI